MVLAGHRHLQHKRALLRAVRSRVAPEPRPAGSRGLNGGPSRTFATAQDIAQVDEIIERLLEVRQGRPGKQVQLAENEIRLLCLTAKEIFMSQPNLLELEAPIKICGAWCCVGGRTRARCVGHGGAPHP